jgi:hypothetical protein
MRTIIMQGMLWLTLMLAAEFHGYISDAACGWNNAREGKEAKECAEMCVKGGWPPVFVRDGGMKVWSIPEKAGRAKVLAFVGDHVTITGTLEGDKLTVERVRKSPPPAPKSK